MIIIFITLSMQEWEEINLIDHHTSSKIKLLLLASVTACGFLITLSNGVSADTNSYVNNQAITSTEPLKAEYAPSYSANNFAQNVTSNQGWFDSIHYNNGQVQVSGWNDVEFINSSTSNSAHHYMILVNSRTGQTVSSKSADNDTVPRPDVARAYPNNANASESGFNSVLNVNWNQTGWNDPLYIISRYSSVLPYNSSDGNGGNGTYTDYRSQNFTLNQLLNLQPVENVAWLDSSNYASGKLTLSGWNAVKWGNDTNVAGLHHYLIIYDQTQHTQLASIDITGQRQLRFDVQNAYRDIPNAYQSGFNATFDINSSAWLNDQLSLVSRFSSVSTGNGDDGNGNHHVDYWMNISRPSWDSEGWLDSAYVSGNQVHLSGWHATTNSYYQPYHFFILWDKTQGRQVGEVVESNQSDSRPDVGRVYPTTYNSYNSGFNVDMNIGSDRSWLTDELQLVSRYSSHNVGNGDTGQGGYTDFWSNPFWLK